MVEKQENHTWSLIEKQIASHNPVASRILTIMKKTELVELRENRLVVDREFIRQLEEEKEKIKQTEGAIDELVERAFFAALLKMLVKRGKPDEIVRIGEIVGEI